MTLEEALDFCAELGFDAVDPTGYYFPGYPEAPPDAYVYAIKNRALRLGLDVSGTGVRNDFTYADPAKRAAARVRAGDRAAWFGLAGALLFGCSDSLLALDRFRGPLSGVDYAIMLSYWAGQLGIALGCGQAASAART